MSAIKDLEDTVAKGETPSDDLVRAAIAEQVQKDAAKKNPTRSRKEKGPEPFNPTVGQYGDDDGEWNHIGSAIHVYQREGETDQAVRFRATRERGDHGPAVLVFQHMHSIGGSCQPACRTKVDES